MKCAVRVNGTTTVELGRPASWHVCQNDKGLSADSDRTEDKGLRVNPL